jgi:hypothetical protein
VKSSAELEAKCLALAERKTTLAPDISEAQFQWEIVKLARRHGWAAHHHFDSRKSEVGWPDLVLIRGPKIIFRELKVRGNTLSAAQANWIDLLIIAGQDAAVWTERDWPAIENILTS